MVRKVRSTKIDAGLKVLNGPMTVKLNNLSAMECNVIRPFFQGALNRFYKMGLVSFPSCLIPASYIPLVPTSLLHTSFAAAFSATLLLTSLDNIPRTAPALKATRSSLAPHLAASATFVLSSEPSA